MKLDNGMEHRSSFIIMKQKAESMEKFKTFIFNGKGNVTLSLGILAAILISSYRLGIKVERMNHKIEQATCNRWTSIHQAYWVSDAENKTGLDLPDPKKS